MKSIRISHIEIKNYKGIDELKLDFPPKQMIDDPDITVLGSCNGIGKTSFLECCALLLLALFYSDNDLNNGLFDTSLDIIRAGSRKTTINGIISIDQSEYPVSFSMTKTAKIETSGFIKKNDQNLDIPKEFFERILGLFSDPFISNNLLFLHSYRKVQEGNPELGMLLDDEDNIEYTIIRYRMIRRRQTSFSLFKRNIIKYMMGQADLFTKDNHKNINNNNNAINIFNELLRTYANVQIGKLRPLINNTIDVLVESLDDNKQIFSIDGLSSGQKEIISTLFTIWDTTKKEPCVVLIDEPELHLNAQWHSSFVKKITEIAPKNQYILATHAEAVMASVRDENQLILTR